MVHMFLICGVATDFAASDRTPYFSFTAGD